MNDSINEMFGSYEDERIQYTDSTYDIVSKVAFLIGVPLRVFENPHEPPKMEIYTVLNKDKNARIIRHLSVLRTSIERGFGHISEKMKYQYKSILNASSTLPSDQVTLGRGTIRIRLYGRERKAGDVGFSLSFQSVKLETSEVKITSARVDNSKHALSGNAPQAVISNSSTKIEVQGYSVTLPTGFKGEATAYPGQDYTFSKPAGSGEYYITAKVNLQFHISLSAGAKSSQMNVFLLESPFCGRLSLQVDKVFLMDYFGFLPLKATLAANAKTTVLPDMFPSEVQRTPAPAISGEGTENRSGPDRSEVYQLREYRPGDDLRQIHWKLSSKLDELVWKEPGMPESRSLLVTWDKRIQTTPNVMDAMAEAVSSVCQGILNAGIPFELCWTEEELHTCRIENEDELLRSIPALVKSAGKADCSLPNFDDFAAVLYIGTQLPKEELSSRVRCLICGETEERNGQIYGFTPKNVQENLRRLEM